MVTPMSSASLNAQQPDAQCAALKQQIRRAHLAIAQAQQRCRQLEEDISAFLEEYYQQVQPCFEQLSALEDALQAVQRECFTKPIQPSPLASALAMQDPTPLPKAPAQLNQDAKQLYRQLAKQHHPDAAAEAVPSKAALMGQISAAYRSGDVAQLWQFKTQASNAASQLAADVAQMQQTLEALKAREETLKASSAFQLMQHARLMQSCGQDFIAMVKGRVQKQIAQQQHALRAARMQAQFWKQARQSQT
jgi:hypothetical protein